MLRKLFLMALTISAATANAATLTPIQLLNPAGSSSGQAIVSTGASSAPAWGGVGVNGIAAIAANTVLANATASSASPTALAVPSCSTSSSALNWTTSGGSSALSCNTSINAATLGGQTFTSPTITTPVINGVTNGSSASSGQVGYAPSATQSSAQSMTTSTAMNITSFSLPAGDYDVSGVGCITTSGSVTNMTVGISTTSATLGALGTYASVSFNIAGNGGGTCITTPQVPLQLSTTTTVYLIGLGAFSSGTMTSTGKIIARVRR